MDPVQMHHSFIILLQNMISATEVIFFFRIGSIIKAKDFSLRYSPMKY